MLFNIGGDRILHQPGDIAQHYHIKGAVGKWGIRDIPLVEGNELSNAFTLGVAGSLGKHIQAQIHCVDPTAHPGKQHAENPRVAAQIQDLQAFGVSQLAGFFRKKVFPSRERAIVNLAVDFGGI